MNWRSSQKRFKMWIQTKIAKKEARRIKYEIKYEISKRNVHETHKHRFESYIEWKRVKMSTAFNKNFVIAEITMCFFSYHVLVCTFACLFSMAALQHSSINSSGWFVCLNESTFQWSENVHLQMLPIVLLFSSIALALFVYLYHCVLVLSLSNCRYVFSCYICFFQIFLGIVQQWL